MGSVISECLNVVVVNQLVTKSIFPSRACNAGREISRGILQLTTSAWKNTSFVCCPFCSGLGGNYVQFCLERDLAERCGDKVIAESERSGARGRVFLPGYILIF